MRKEYKYAVYLSTDYTSGVYVLLFYSMLIKKVTGIYL